MNTYSVVRYLDGVISCRICVNYNELLTTAKKWNNSQVEDYNVDSWKAFQLTVWNETVDITPQVKHDIS